MTKKNNKKKNISQEKKVNGSEISESSNELKSLVALEDNCNEKSDEYPGSSQDSHKVSNSNDSANYDKTDIKNSTNKDHNKEEEPVNIKKSEENNEENMNIDSFNSINENKVQNKINSQKEFINESFEKVKTNNEITETTNSTPAKTEIKTTRKRLTLQERLALAAKVKSKKQDPSPSTTPPSTPPATTSPTTETPKLSEALNSTEKTEKEILNKVDYSSRSVENELKQLRSELLALNIKNRDLSNRLKNQDKSEKSNVAFENSIKELMEKLQKKDDTIGQLLQEGEILSKKELKLNDKIKKLKSLNNDLDISLKEYSLKNDDMAIKLNELEDFLKLHNFNSVENLISSYSQNLSDLQKATESLNKEKDEVFEKKIEELQKTQNTETVNKEKALKENQELKIQLEMLKKQHSLELQQKEKVIIDLKKNNKFLKDEKNEEITRLESKIESLRIENESTGSSSGNDPKNNNSTKLVDYDEFVRLSETHYNLQKQHLSSQEVWKLAESNLLNKVDTLTASLDSLKKGNQKISNELRKTQNMLQTRSEELKSANETIDNLRQNVKSLNFQIESRNNELKEEQERFGKFRQIYNADRDNMNLKIKNLTEAIEETKNSQINQANIYNIDPRNSTRTLSSNSVLEFSGNYNWADIKLGESSTTPAISKDVSSFLELNHNHSQLSFTEIDEESELDDHKSQIDSSSMGITGTIPNTSMHNNIQFISKMSSNIRRLEVELNTFRDENNQLCIEKEEIQKELLKKINLNDEIEARNKKIDELNEEILKRTMKEQTMLELIGEKSEQVEELRADVQDLKDLCKLQVQQMIELQESKAK